MSYDIIYNKQFIKLRKTGEVIPMLLAGSSNCFEIGTRGRNGRRTRSWASDRFYNRKGKLSEKPEIILKKLDAELRKIIRQHRGDKEAKPADIRNRFGYYVAMVVGSGYCSDTSWEQYRSVYANGIKKALTIEQLDILGVNPCFAAFCDSPDGKPTGVPLKTEAEYFIELKKWREWREKSGGNFYLDFCPYNTDTVLQRLRANNRRVPREKSPVEKDHFFVLSNNSGHLKKYTRNGFRYTYQPEYAKKFMTEKEADNFRKQLVVRGKYMAETWQVKRVDYKATFMV